VLFAQTSVENGAVTIRLGDSGPGISPEKVRSLFSRYQSGIDAGRRRSTGLGLYIARAIICAHGGDLAFDDQRHPGAWFVAALPVATAEQRKMRPQPVAA
jgi:K+-sensing histidine kinase KdpD